MAKYWTKFLNRMPWILEVNIRSNIYQNGLLLNILKLLKNTNNEGGEMTQTLYAHMNKRKIFLNAHNVKWELDWGEDMVSAKVYIS
jgi:hypothetical protein